MKGSFVLIIAIVVGVLAAVLVRNQIRNERLSVLENWDAVQICVTGDRLPEGHVIDVESDIVPMQVPKRLATLPEYVVWDQRASLQGQYVNTVIAQGKILDRRYLGKRSGQTNEQIKPDKGRRLIAIKVNEVTGTAGHLKPGDKVDVLHTSGELVTQLILEDILVRHTGKPQRGRSARSGANTNYTTVTFEASVREAMVLANAGATGTLTLIKRRGSGGTVTNTEAQPVKAGDYRSQLGGN